MEWSRGLLEARGIGIAAISYDSRETLLDFTRKHSIGFPLLSDRDSEIIRRFRVLNANIAPGLRAHGVPHPVEYLVSPDGIVVRKYFVPNYQHRVNGAAVAMREFDAVKEDAPSVTLQSGAVAVRMGLSSAKAFAGQQVGFFAKFVLEPGWHIYGAPAPEGYSTTSVVFDDPKVIDQKFELPEASPMITAGLRETLPVYSGSFRGVGSLLLKFPLPEGPMTLSGRVSLQQCSDTICEPPEALPFELHLELARFLVAESGT